MKAVLFKAVWAADAVLMRYYHARRELIGTTAIEYGLIAALIVVVLITAINTINKSFFN